MRHTLKYRLEICGIVQSGHPLVPCDVSLKAKSHTNLVQHSTCVRLRAVIETCDVRDKTCSTTFCSPHITIMIHGPNQNHPRCGETDLARCKQMIGSGGCLHRSGWIRLLDTRRLADTNWGGTTVTHSKLKLLSPS